jgi:plasmid stabilization system protein ParE
MPYLSWSPRALRDVYRLRRFLEEKSSRAGQRAVDQIGVYIERLLLFPRAGRPIDQLPNSYRELIVPFSTGGYIVRYQLVGDEVRILAIRHQRESGF